MRLQFDAVIAGAGPAGSAAAILLARAGWSVALVEKQRYPRRKVCGECVAASNLPLLDTLGVGAAFDACAGPALRQVALMRGASTIVADLPPAAGRHRWGRALGRATLDTLLLDQARATGATVLQPWVVREVADAGVEKNCTIVAVDSHDTVTLRAPVLLAAHGSWEPLPAARATRRTTRAASDLFAFKANFRGAALREGLLPVLSFRGGYGGMVVADGGKTTVACCVRRDRLEAARRSARGAGAGDVVEDLLQQECAGVWDALRAAERTGPWLAAGPLDPGIHLRAHDPFFRLGNAAGEAHPILGEGLSMALQSAFLLCAHLLAAPRPCDAQRLRAVARGYAADWRRAFAPRLLLAAAFAHAAMRPLPGAALIALARAWPGLLTEGARWGGKLESAADPAALLARDAG